MLYQREKVLNLRPNCNDVYLILTFNNSTFYSIYVFCVDLKTNSDHLYIQQELILFYNRDFTLGSLVVSTCTTWLKFDNSTFSPHCIYVFCIYLGTNSDF